jgi:hypothetical protein
VRQFLTWQFWLSLAALAALTIVLVLVTRSQDDAQASLVAAPIGEEAGAATDTKSEQPIDLIVLSFAAQGEEGFDFVDGRSTKRTLVYIDGFRYMDIPAGTPGENRCPGVAELAKCVVAADLLGDAVLWFSFLPLEPRNLITLPGIAEVRDGGKVLLDNGWVIRRAPVIERECETDTVGLNDFLERFSGRSTSTYSIEEQAIVSVTCLGES